MFSGSELPTFREIRLAALREALRRTKGNRTKAAEMLEIALRTVRYWIIEFELEEEFPGVSCRPDQPRRLKKRKCLKCGRVDPSKRRTPGLCAMCKRHVDYKDGGDDDYSVDF